MIKTFILGDIHGSYKALKQVLKKSNFNYEFDKLIFLGDVCDGWSGVDGCIEELMKIKNLIFLRGNHDQWTIDYYTGKLGGSDNFKHWLKYGGDATYSCYEENIDYKHLEFLLSSIFYYEFDDCLFVHAGIIPNVLIQKQSPDIFLWDRKLVFDAFENQCKKNIAENYKEVFVGHTPIKNFAIRNNKINPNKPQKFSNINLLDTGCAFDGVLTLMDYNTREIFQSDPSYKIYPNEKGRNKNH